nr:hypothetical protein [Tanacetum cinerariifolium]
MKLQRHKFKLMLLLRKMFLRMLLMMLFPYLHRMTFHLLHKNHLHLLKNNKRVENLENDNAAQKLVIVKLKARVKKLEKANKIKSLKLRRLRKAGASRRVESSADMEDVFNQGRMIDDMDMDEGIGLVKDADIAESEGRHAEKQAEIYNLDLDHSLKVLSMQEDDFEVQEVVEVVTTAKLITEVVTAAALQVSAASAPIPAAKPSILVAAPTVVAAYTIRRKGVIIRDPEEELPLKTPDETPKVKDKGKGILVETPKPMKKKDQIELDAEYVKKLHEEINKDYEEFSNDINWDATMDHKAAKRRKLSEEAQEAEDLRNRLEVVEDEDDDVFVEATSLASKLFLLVERRYLLSRFTLEQLVNVTRLQVEEENNTAAEEFVGNKMHKAFPLPGESSHWQYKFPLPVEGV